MIDVPWAGARPRHRFYVPDAATSALVTFSSSQAHQLRRVLRLGAGDSVRVFDGLQPRDLVVRLESVGSTAAGVVEGWLPQPPEPACPIHLYPALLPRDVFEQVLQKSVEVGVASVTPVIAERCVARDRSDESRRERWQSIMREAAEQCGRGVVPRLHEPRAFAVAVDDTARVGPTLIAWEAETSTSLEAALKDVVHPAAMYLFVGPEGGLTVGEVDLARQHGARTVTLGPRTLRADTAAVVLTALVADWLAFHEGINVTSY